MNMKENEMYISFSIDSLCYDIRIRRINLIQK